MLYYYPDPNTPGRYNTNGTRYFYNYATGQIITQRNRLDRSAARQHFTTVGPGHDSIAPSLTRCHETQLVGKLLPVLTRANVSVKTSQGKGEAKVW